jgi:DNA replication initiation complex subunit (GINS family)
MIAFSDIYEAMRKEKYSEKIQQLPRKFLTDVYEYLNEKRAFIEKDKDHFSDVHLRNKKKLENSLASFRDLLRLRKKKILSLAFVAAEVGISKKDFEHLLSFEKDLFEELVRSLEKAEENMNADMMGAAQSERKHRLVRFLEDVPEFIGFEGNSIGPFQKGIIANIEQEIVEILEQDNRVEIIEEE